MSVATSSGRLRVSGKQLMLDDQHLADCVTEAAALALRDALDFAGVAFTETPSYASANMLALLCGARVSSSPCETPRADTAEGEARPPTDE